MVVNESALLRAMREDYKGQGYTVARRAENEADPESESILLLSANDWMVEIGWKNVSAKIFGLVAEHMKGLPEVGQAFKVKKKETNTVIFDMVEKFPKADAKKQAEAETRQQVAQAREEAAKAAAAQQEAKYRAELDQAKQAEEEAQRRAETMAKQMEASSDENAVRFFMLFEQLQQKVEDMKAGLGKCPF